MEALKVLFPANDGLCWGQVRIKVTITILSLLEMSVVNADLELSVTEGEDAVFSISSLLAVLVLVFLCC